MQSTAKLQRLLEQTTRRLRDEERLGNLFAYLTGNCDEAELLPKAAREVCALNFAGCSILTVGTDENGCCFLQGELISPFTDSVLELPSLAPYPDLTGLIRSQTPSFQLPAAHGLLHELSACYGNIPLAAALFPIRCRGSVLALLLVLASQAHFGQELAEYTCDDSLFSAYTLNYLIRVANMLGSGLGNALLQIQMRDAQDYLQLQNVSVQEQAAELIEMNAELISVQNELQAQYYALESANSRLAALATTDGMTTLANHRAFQEEIARQVARVERSQAPLSLLLVDVDRFKQYNDSFGHPAGDVVLQMVGRLIAEIVREGDYPARYGGEEFAVILPDTEAETARQVAERLRAAVAATDFPNREITISVGIAQHSPAESAATIIQRADIALYEAKSAGRNCVIVLPSTLSSWSNAETEAAAATVRAPSDSESDGPPSLALSLESADSTSTDAEQAGNHSFWNAEDGGIEGLLQETPAAILSELLDVLDRRYVLPTGHTQRIIRFALRLGQELADYYEEQRSARPLLPILTSGDLINIAYGALLHDIGKSGISDAILRKESQLTSEEWRQIRRHPLVGAELIAPSPLFSRALPVVRYHHERWDGTGYPQGLVGDAIPLGARVFAVCNVFDILLASTPYHKKRSFEEAREEIVQGSGTQFDPDVVMAFLRIPESEWERIDPRLSQSPPSNALRAA